MTKTTLKLPQKQSKSISYEEGLEIVKKIQKKIAALEDTTPHKASYERTLRF